MGCLSVCRLGVPRRPREKVMATRLMPPPDLEPTLQLGILKPEVRVEVVGEDGVFGGRKPGGTTLDLAGQELACHALEGRVDQVVDVRSGVADEGAHVVQQVSGVQIVDVEQGQEKVGIEIATVEQRVNEAVCVHGGNGEGIKHALPSPSPWSLVVKVEPPNNLDRARRRRYARSAYGLTAAMQNTTTLRTRWRSQRRQSVSALTSNFQRMGGLLTACW